MAPTDTTIRIGLVGDLHGSWSARDADYFNQSGYDLLLFTGDLGSGTKQNGVQISRSVARLERTTLVIAGNNDAPFGPEIAAEFRYQHGMAELMRLAPAGHAATATTQVSLCGYDVRTFMLKGRRLSVLIGRPYAMGGSELSFAAQLSARYGVHSLAESETRLRQLVDACASQDVLWLAHNGPTGLGSAASDIWGCDFRPEAGDWGDADLRTAIDYSRQKGKRVLAVIAGHMHRGIPARRQRPHNALHRTSVVEDDGILYVNPALVPRVYEQPLGLVRHHMVLEWPVRDGVRVEDVFVPDEG